MATGGPDLSNRCEGGLEHYKRLRYAERWAVVEGGVLKIYKSRDEAPATPGRTARASQSPKLTLSIAVITWSTEAGSRRFVVDSGSQTYTLRAASPQDRNRWIQALEFERARCPTTTFDGRKSLNWEHAVGGTCSGATRSGPAGSRRSSRASMRPGRCGMAAAACQPSRQAPAGACPRASLMCYAAPVPPPAPARPNALPPGRGLKRCPLPHPVLTVQRAAGGGQDPRPRPGPGQRRGHPG
eukprot:SAG22_NODE_1410_length_4481_cov_10.703788_3_plen_241_part_00